MIIRFLITNIMKKIIQFLIIVFAFNINAKIEVLENINKSKINILLDLKNANMILFK